MNTRAIATQVLTEVLLNQQSLTEALPKFKKLCRKPEDAAFVQALCFGFLRAYPRLQFIAKQLMNHPLKPRDADLLFLICLGLYQLIELNTKPHAAISETVEATRQLDKPWASGLVNAILRQYLRQKDTLLSSIAENEEALYQHPEWLIQEIRKAWPLDWENILEANNKQAALVLRVNLQKITRDHYLEVLIKAGINAHAVKELPAGIILETPCEVTKLPGFSEGLVSVQDGSAQWAASLLDLSEGMQVLDACAAPGGKTAHMIELEPKLARLLALDISEERSAKIKENLKRLQLNAEVLTADANQIKTWWDGVLFDRILLDAPCSATGVIRRHPDIKFLRQKNDIPNYTKQQLRLLKNLWSCLKHNGRLLYATCSVLPAENQNVIEQFLNDEPSAFLLPFPCKIEWGAALAVGHQFLPGQNGMDGFYYAGIGKKEAK